MLNVKTRWFISFHNFPLLLLFLISFTFFSHIVECVSCLLTRRDYYRFMLYPTSIIFYSQTLFIRPIFIFLLLVVLVSRSITFLHPGFFIFPRFRFDVNTLYFQLSFVLYYNVFSFLKRLRFSRCFGNSDIICNVHVQELCWISCLWFCVFLSLNDKCLITVLH